MPAALADEELPVLLLHSGSAVVVCARLAGVDAWAGASGWWRERAPTHSPQCLLRLLTTDTLLAQSDHRPTHLWSTAPGKETLNGPSVPARWGQVRVDILAAPLRRRPLLPPTRARHRSPQQRGPSCSITLPSGHMLEAIRRSHHAGKRHGHPRSVARWRVGVVRPPRAQIPEVAAQGSAGAVMHALSGAPSNDQNLWMVFGGVR